MAPPRLFVPIRAIPPVGWMRISQESNIACQECRNFRGACADDLGEESDADPMSSRLARLNASCFAFCLPQLQIIGGVEPSAWRCVIVARIKFHLERIVETARLMKFLIRRSTDPFPVSRHDVHCPFDRIGDFGHGTSSDSDAAWRLVGRRRRRKVRDGSHRTRNDIGEACGHFDGSRV